MLSQGAITAAVGDRPNPRALGAFQGTPTGLGLCPAASPEPLLQLSPEGSQGFHRLAR